MESIRSFIAIELPGEIKRAITGLQQELRSGTNAPVKWVGPNSIHLTLKFLGNIQPPQVAGITASLTRAGGEVGPFSLGLGVPGVFPNLRRVRVVWVGLTGDLEPLGVLQKAIDRELRPLGFHPEQRFFTPHLTLGRVRDQATNDERQALGQLISGAHLRASGEFSVNHVDLMRSQLSREGAVYTRLASVPLGRP